jgi:hypothetical protein
MHKRFALLGFVFLLIVAPVLNSALEVSATSQYQHLSSAESEIVSRINGTSIYNYDLELEKIALDHNQSLYSFRSSGSVGANETATWIQRQFKSFGLEPQLEPFELTTWNVVAQPVLIIDADGNLNTTDDQVQISSFQCEHYSWPTPDGGTFAGLVTLPARYDAATWIATDTTGKVLLIGGDVLLNRNWALAFKNKMEIQPPAAIIFVPSSDTPPVFSPYPGKVFGDLKIPVGWVSYGDGQLIRGKMTLENVSALVSVRAVLGQGPHYNVVAKLPGSVNPEKDIIISAHYDSVMSAAFCDDGSGTSAVLELAKVFSEAAREGIYEPQYTLVFVAFAGGELGLAGSVNYVKEHASELGNIVAVINLDSLGNTMTEITKTFPDDIGLDLQSVVMEAGNDLNVTIMLTDPKSPGIRSSDQEAFRDPVDTDDAYLHLWGAGSGIRNMTRVKSSIMIGSESLSWIHTENDNSTSYPMAGYVYDLESQTRVAGLSVMRVLSTILNPFLLELYGSVTAAGIVVAVAAYFERSRLKSFYKGFAQEVHRYIGLREVLFMMILTIIFLFSSFALYSTVGEIEVINQGHPTIATIQYFGAPFEMFGIISAQFTTSEGGQLVQSQAGGIIMLWGGLLENFALFLLSAFVITYATVKFKSTRELSKR